MNTAPKITSTATMNVPGSLTAGALRDFATSVPSEARVTINVDRGTGQLDPGYTTLTATWEGSPKKPGMLPQSHIPGARGGSSNLTAQRDNQ